LAPRRDICSHPPQSKTPDSFLPGFFYRVLRRSGSDLLNKGHTENQGYTVYTTEFWKSNRDVEIRRHMKKWFPPGLFEAQTHVEETAHRHVLQLPSGGALLKSKIEQAFKLCAKSAHPDAGGSDEQFKQLLAARDALVQSWRR
jgi:hypothetical protein